MRNRLLIIAAISAVWIGPVRAEDPKPSGQCWSDGTCLGQKLDPAPPVKVEPGEEDRARTDNGGRPFYRAPIYVLPPPVPYTSSMPTPSICYVLANGIYSPIACPPPPPPRLPQGRYRR